MLLRSRSDDPRTSRTARDASDYATRGLGEEIRTGRPSLVGDVAKFLITRGVLKRVARVGGVQGLLLSAAATYAIDRYFQRRR